MCKADVLVVSVVAIVCASVAPGLARRSPNADLIEEYYVKGPEAGRYSNNLLEDAMLDVPGLIAKYGYPIEIHNAITEDGYILELHRIPHGRDENNVPDPRKPVVLVQHGLCSSSADFVVMGPGTALAYVFAEAGFDVWLGNARGNYYSRRHLTLDPDYKPDTGRNDFWTFSWEEIGSKDLPAMIDYILAITGKPGLHYVGHSQGTTVFFVMGSLRPEYNNKIISMQAYAPVAYMEHNTNPILGALAPYANSIEVLASIFGIDEILSKSPFYAWIGNKFCSDEAISQIVCSHLLFLIGGRSEELHNATMLPLKLAHTPAGISLRQLAHYGQHIHKGYFRRYNYGPISNLIVYGSFQPPLIDLSLVTAPVFLHYAEVDPFAALPDVDRLWRELGRPIQKILVPHRTFSHVDFMWGTEAKSLLYDKTINILRSIEDL
ncbi:lipase 3-like [Galleria mellonella]|uniref:Lipase n=1 Tax=Galleria mellonella TaxID=7137 RepID=A0A6J1WFF4_GALME|nr:lipase 3-like [Galleria mellonella]